MKKEPLSLADQGLSGFCMNRCRRHCEAVVITVDRAWLCAAHLVELEVDVEQDEARQRGMREVGECDENELLEVQQRHHHAGHVELVARERHAFAVGRAGRRWK